MNLRGVAVGAVLLVSMAGRAAAQEPPAVPASTGLARPAAVVRGAGGVNFSFDAADIKLLIRLVGEITGRRFVMGDKVEGTVTVISSAPVPVSEVYPLFLSILEARGFTVVEREGTSFVISLAEAAPTAMAPMSADGTGLVTRILKPIHIDAVDFGRSIEPLVRGGKAGGVTAFAPSNHLLITDTADSVRRIELILAEIDRPGAGSSIEVVPLKHASAEELSRQVAAAIAGAEKAGSAISRHIRQVAEGGALQPSGALVVASPHANSLVLVGTAVQIAEIRKVIAMLDVEPPSGGGRLNAIFLKYLSAQEAATNLNALLARTVEKDQRQRIAVEPNLANNALVIDAGPTDFQWLKELIEKLDQAPRQVLVEVVIAEMDLGKQLDLGVEWATTKKPEGDSVTAMGRSRPGPEDTIMNAITQGIFPQGIAVGIAHGADDDGAPRLSFVLQALRQNRDVRILSSVPLWAQNNAEAKVNVVENIPVLKSTIEGGAGTSRDVIQNIDRMDVGIKLKLKPHVNPDGQITLELNPSIEAIVDEGSPEVAYTPTIARREVTTTVTVPDRSTVVITGLIRQDQVKQEYKVPVLGDIPLLGALFRYTSDRTVRNNLLIFVTPTLITDMKQADALRRTMEERTQVPPVTNVAVSASIPEGAPPPAADRRE